MSLPVAKSELSKDEFIQSYGYTLIGPAGGDCGPRQYYRVAKNERTAIVMDGVPDAVNTLPDHLQSDFIRIADWLRGQGIRTPEIFEADLENGFLLIEDFGSTTVKAAAEQNPSQERDLYEKAVNILIQTKELDDGAFPNYFDTLVNRGHRRVLDWFYPAIRERQIDAVLFDDYKAAWREIEHNLPLCPRGFLHGDFHAENLMVLEDGTLGVIDFQGAMSGAMPYDLGNLLEDARRSLPKNLQTHLKLAYLNSLNAEDRDGFDAWYRILATQFHCRVIGQFIKIPIQTGNHIYLDYLPILARHIQAALSDPIMEPLSVFFSDIGLGFDDVPEIVTNRVKQFIRDDAI